MGDKARNEEDMRRIKFISLIGALALVLAACGTTASTTTTAAPDTPDATDAPDTPDATDAPDTTDAVTDEPTDEPTDENPLAEYNEDPTAADPALVEKALGPITAPVGDPGWDIVLASIARAEQDLDQATIDKAMECWSNVECDTGSGGDLVLGYADGGGHINVWRGVTHMEAILQALSYPEIGKIVSQEALWQYDPAIQGGQIDFLIQYPVDLIVGYPDFPELVYENVAAAEAAGIPYVPFSGGWVGIPGVHDFALVPGTDYTAVVGEDLCALGQSKAAVLNEHAPDGELMLLGGTTGNGLTLEWQQCLLPEVTGTVVNPPPNETTTAGDTFWLNDVALQQVSAQLSTNPNLAGFAYEYADGMFTALQAYDDLGIPFPENLTLAMRTDEQSLFCDWIERSAANPGYRIFFTAGGNFQSRTSVTAAMLALQDAPVPGDIVVPHVVREVTADDCDPDRASPTVSGTSLVPDELLALMFAG